MQTDTASKTVRVSGGGGGGTAGALGSQQMLRVGVRKCILQQKDCAILLYVCDEVTRQVVRDRWTHMYADSRMSRAWREVWPRANDGHSPGEHAL